MHRFFQICRLVGSYVLGAVLALGAAFLISRAVREPAEDPAAPETVACVAGLYARQHKAAVDRILDGTHDWKVFPLEDYAGIARLHGGILAETQAAAAACGDVTAQQVREIVAALRAQDPDDGRDRDTLCLAVYMRQSGFNPCEHE